MLMVRVLLFALAGLEIVAFTPAWAQPEFPAAAIDEKAKLLGETKTRYLLRQIDLTEEQATHARGLIDSILAEGNAPSDVNVDQVREIWTQLEQAKEAKDQEKVDELTKQLQRIGQQASGDADVFANLEPQLTDQQKQKLAQARARLEHLPSGALRPIDLIRAARSLNLTTQQERKLVQASIATREMLGPLQRPSVDLKLRMMTYLVGEIRALLTPDQAAQFEHRIRALRPDLVDEGLLVRTPETEFHAQPADVETSVQED
jgi:hypothetical protein